MKTVGIAISIGLMIEMLLGAATITKIGPCGPASPMAALVLFIHWPAIAACSALNLSDPFTLTTLGLLYTAIWSSLAYVILRKRTAT